MVEGQSRKGVWGALLAPFLLAGRKGWSWTGKDSKDGWIMGVEAATGGVKDRPLRLGAVVSLLRRPSKSRGRMANVVSCGHSGVRPTVASNGKRETKAGRWRGTRQGKASTPARGPQTDPDRRDAG